MTDLAGSVAAVYDFAADHIETYGWTQGRSFDRTAGLPVWESPACLHGALCLMFVEHARDTGISNSILMWRVMEEIGKSVTRWNDTPGREQWEVVELLRMMAKRARAGDLDLA